MPKGDRKAQSHEIAKRVRPAVQAVAGSYGARVKVAEVPPGPPVLQTLVAEVYGPDYERQVEVARKVEKILSGTTGVVDVDWYVEDDQPKFRFVVDEEKAALTGVTAEQIAATLRLALSGTEAGLLHAQSEKEDVPIVVRLPRAERSRIEELKQLRVMGRQGSLVPLSEVTHVEEETAGKSIYHKNLMPVVYVTADVAGAVESPVYAILKLNQELDKLKLPEGYKLERYVRRSPERPTSSR